MKKFKSYINTMYRPAFITLCAGLTVFSFSLCLLALNLHAEISSGNSYVVYVYPQMIERILFPLYILLPVTFSVDLKERSKGKS